MGSELPPVNPASIVIACIITETSSTYEAVIHLFLILSQVSRNREPRKTGLQRWKKTENNSRIRVWNSYEKKNLIESIYYTIFCMFPKIFFYLFLKPHRLFFWILRRLSLRILVLTTISLFLFRTGTVQRNMKLVLIGLALFAVGSNALDAGANKGLCPGNSKHCNDPLESAEIPHTKIQ